MAACNRPATSPCRCSPPSRAASVTRGRPAPARSRHRGRRRPRSGSPGPRATSAPATPARQMTRPSTIRSLAPSASIRTPKACIRNAPAAKAADAKPCLADRHGSLEAEAVLDIEGSRRLQRAEAQDHHEGQQQHSPRGRRPVPCRPVPSRQGGVPSPTPAIARAAIATKPPAATTGQREAEAHQHRHESRPQYAADAYRRTDQGNAVAASRAASHRPSRQSLPAGCRRQTSHRPRARPAARGRHTASAPA